MNLADEIKNGVAGSSILTDWLGEGGTPIDSVSANARADVCLNDCPKHRKFKWWELFKEPIALTIRLWLAKKSEMNLELEKEDKLFMCGVCGCCLRLKPWTPISHLSDHTDDETLNKYPGNCWLPKELNEYRQSRKSSVNH
jgi:hypothetical protein